MPTVVVTTQWNGIQIRHDPAKDPTFALTVKEQLALINSRPVGRSMLEGIAARDIPTSMTYKVEIRRSSSEFDLYEKVLWKRAKGTNTTFGVKMDAAKTSGGKPGVGTPSVIKYNPNAYESPDGRRPPWMGLAHELVHAYNNAHGLSLSPAEADEALTTGLKNVDAPINENKIRAEHGIAARTTYYGLIGPQDHDAS